jgi:hypothetical protein
MIPFLIAASLIGQCPGGTCPLPVQVLSAPQFVYFVQPPAKEVRVTETTKTTIVFVQTQNRKAGLFRRGVILPLFANGSGQACLGSCR